MEAGVAIGAVAIIFGGLIFFVVVQKRRITGGLQEFADRCGLSFRQVDRVRREVSGTHDGREVEFFTFQEPKTQILCEHWKVEIDGCPETLSCFQKSTIQRFDETGIPRVTLGNPEFDDHVAAIDDENPDASRHWLTSHGQAVRAILESSPDHWIEGGALRFEKRNLDTKPDKLVARLSELEEIAGRLE